mgnify:CR=1 FL=1
MQNAAMNIAHLLRRVALAAPDSPAILEGDRQFALTVRMAPEYRSNIDAVRNIRVAYTNANGGNSYIPLSALAEGKVTVLLRAIFYDPAVMSAIVPDFTPFQPAVARACRYAA